jgi:hypothetical protein
VTNGRQIGRAFEQRIARDIRGWLPGSTVKRLRNDEQASAGEFQIDWPDGPFPFAIEAKHHKSFSLAHLWSGAGSIWNAKSKRGSWWGQCVRQAEAGGMRPMLLANVPRQFVIAILLARDLDRISTDHWSVEMDIKRDGVQLVAVLWDEMLQTPPALLARMEQT